LGRPILFVIAADPAVTSAAEAAASGKVVVYLQANIHGGEVEGKEAVLALLRELVGPRRELLQKLVVLVAPDYNPDGNDAFGPQAVNRSEQNGPALIGQRADGKNLDLNRDYFKAEAPETRASLARVYTTWDPALMVDLHTTDGTLHGYQLTYAPPLDPNGPAGPSTFVRDRMLPALRKTLQDKYHESIFDYGNVETPQAPQSWDTYAPLGWYGTNYVGLRGRMAILSEAYSHADFKTRVQVTHDFQGHHLLEVTGTWARTPRSVPAGCYFVSTAQPLGRLVFALLEPEGFGLARWGAFSRAPGMQLGASAGREFPVWRAERAPRAPSRVLP